MIMVRVAVVQNPCFFPFVIQNPYLFPFVVQSPCLPPLSCRAHVSPLCRAEPMSSPSSCRAHVSPLCRSEPVPTGVEPRSKVKYNCSLPTASGFYPLSLDSTSLDSTQALPALSDGGKSTLAQSNRILTRIVLDDGGKSMPALDDHYKNQNLYRQPLQVLISVMVMMRVDVIQACRVDVIQACNGYSARCCCSEPMFLPLCHSKPISLPLIVQNPCLPLRRAEPMSPPFVVQSPCQRAWNPGQK